MSQTKAQLISDLVQALNFTGTSSAPANGVYLSAANTIKLATNSNPRLTIDSSGNATFGGTVTTANTLSVINTSNLGDAFLYIKAGESGGSVLEFQADEGDDNNDLWRIQNGGDSKLGFRSKESGSWVEKLGIATNGNATFAGTCTATTFIGALTGNASGSAATVTGAAQTAITSVGTLTGLQITNHLGLGVAATEFGSGVKTIVLQGASSTKSGCINFKEYSSGAALANIFAQNDTTYGLSIGTRCSGEDGDFIRFHTGALGSTRMYIKSDGNVGIGTTSPRRHFHIHNSASATVGMMLTNGNTGEADDSQGFQFKVGSDSHAEIAQLENSYIQILTNGSNAMRITNDQKVGIGTTAPGSLLELNAANDTAKLTFLRTGTTIGGSINTRDEAGANGKGLTYIAKDGNSSKAQHVFCTDDGSNVVERLKINENGSIAVGTVGGTYSLELENKISNDVILSLNNSTNNEDCGIRITGSHTGVGTRTSKIGHTIVTSGTGLQLHSPDNIVLYTGSTATERLRIDDNGIKFQGDTAADNALDDYEEGHWDITSNNTLHTSYDRGWYVKIGHMVNCGAYVQSDQTIVNTDALTFTLPFATSAAPVGGDTGWIGACSTNNFIFNTGRTQTVIAAGDATSTSTIREMGDSVTWISMTRGQFTDGRLMQFTLTYKCA